MNEKIIIENQTDLPLHQLLGYVENVLREGRVSNDGKNYCYGTVWKNGIVVYVDKNKRSDRFVIEQRDPKEVEGAFSDGD